LLIRLKQWARRLKRDVVALWLAAQDSRVPWYAKAFCAVIAGYALSPLDLIPDFIPVLGYLDELILLPFAIMLAVRLIPTELMIEFRNEADRRIERPVSRRAAVVVIVVWIAAAVLLAWLLWSTFTG